MVLLLDASGSMRRTDPANTRQRAAELFAQLLGPGNAVAVVEFADSPRVLTPLTPLDSPASRAHVVASIRRVGATGRFTDITAAIESALTCFDLSAETARCVVLLTDGQIDLEGGAEAERLSRARLRTGALARCAERGIPVHTVAFSEESSAETLHEIAAATQGQSHLATDPAQLPAIFADLFELIDQPQMAPIVGDTVHVDASVSDVTFLLSHPGGASAPVELITPSGRVLSAASAEGGGVRWSAAPEFDLVTIEGPEPGAWRVRPVTERDRVVIVSDLGLAVSPVPRQVAVGSAVSLQAWLTERDHPLRDEQILSTVSCELSVTDAEGHTTRVTMADDGAHDDLEARDWVFGAVTDPLRQAGLHRLTVVAQGPTFARQRSVLVQSCEDWVRATLDPAVAAPGEGVVIQAQMDRSAPRLAALSLTALITDPSGTEHRLDLPPVSGGLYAAQFRAATREGAHSVAVVLEGSDETGQAVRFAATPLILRIDPSRTPAPQLPPEPEGSRNPVAGRSEGEGAAGEADGDVVAATPAERQRADGVAEAATRETASARPAETGGVARGPLLMIWGGVLVTLVAALGLAYPVLRGRLRGLEPETRLQQQMAALAAQIGAGRTPSAPPASAAPEISSSGDAAPEPAPSPPDASAPATETAAAPEAEPVAQTPASDAPGPSAPRGDGGESEVTISPDELIALFTHASADPGLAGEKSGVQSVETVKGEGQSQ